MKPDETNTPPQQAAIAGADKIPPKFCTSLDIRVLNNRNVVFTMLYVEGEGGPWVLIDRIIVDIDHAKQIAKVLTEAIEASTNNENE